ncbi:hypothetical protein JCM11251_004483 [Rhodosporidiobolus azoricus]
MSATVSSVARVTATIVGPALSTATATLPAAPGPSAHPASIFDPSFPSNPVFFDSTNPLVLFITQAFIIVALSRVLHFFLRYLRQPRVISEVIAGILIGPSAFGRIPGFTATIFPPQSVPYINLVANLGLCLFLFLVGIEVDFGLFRRNAKVSMTMSSVGLVIPFALGAAIAKPIFDRFVDTDNVDFGTFLLFIGVANAITAFPVLARILTDEGLLKNHVGVIVLTAGVGNDVVGWILLALAIALVNASSGLIVLYVILTSIGWIAVCWFVGRPALKYVGRKTASFGPHGPSQTMTLVTLFMVLISAWITDRIGIHAIFGAFIVGLIVPKEIKASLSEKIEDLVTVLLLPLYFALSGLKTDLGTLNDGSIWGWVVCVCVVAFFSKFLSAGGVGKAFGMTWREAGASGALMACKGLVELIVLNIGLNAGILSTSTFSIFVVMALVTTFLTTPITLAFYPVWYRNQRDRELRGLPPLGTSSSSADGGFGGMGDETKPRTRFAVVVEHFGQLPAVMGFLGLIKPHGAQQGQAVLPSLERADEHHRHSADEKADHKDRSKLKSLLSPLKKVKSTTAAAKETDERSSSADSTPKDGAHFSDPLPDASVEKYASPPFAPASVSKTPTLSALRLVALTDRTSTLLRSAEPETALLRTDALAGVLRAFASSVIGLPTKMGLSLTAPEQYAEAVARWVEEEESEVVLVPWTLPAQSGAGADGGEAEQSVAEALLPNPLEGLFGGKENVGNSVGVMGAVGYAGVVRRVFAQSPCDVALLLDRTCCISSSSTASLLPTLAGRNHLHLTFHGGSDDRLALSLVVQLVSSNPGLTATVLRLTRAPEPTDEDRDVLGLEFQPSLAALSSPPITREDAPLFTVSGTAHGGIGIADTVYATNAGAGGPHGANALQSESADEALFSRFFDGEAALVDETTRARIQVTTSTTAHPLRFANAKLSHLRAVLAPTRVPLVVFAGRGRRDAPSQTLELTQLLKEHVDVVRTSVLVSSEVRRAVGDAAAGVLLGKEVETAVAGAVDERMVVVQRRGKCGFVG